MSGCEANRVDDLFGLARSAPMVAKINAELAAAEAESTATSKPARRFRDFT